GSAAGASATSDGPASPAASASGSASGLVSSPGSASASGSAAVVVDVVGKVRHPGVYRLAAGARVDDAVRAAGGAVGGTDLARLNLARKLVDGEQLAVGVAGASSAPPPAVDTSAADGSAGGSSTAAAGPLDLNAATETQLDALPGVGPVLAQRIIDWRTAHGRFDSVQQLNSVSGIGDAKFADLAPLVSVG
ncbi:MAG: DNA-binding protein, partial [Frankiales bacterium]|nr:DNA-binding protein [Frankiales bacterium]